MEGSDVFAGRSDLNRLATNLEMAENVDPGKKPHYQGEFGKEMRKTFLVSHYLVEKEARKRGILNYLPKPERVIGSGILNNFQVERVQTDEGPAFSASVYDGLYGSDSDKPVGEGDILYVDKSILGSKKRNFLRKLFGDLSEFSYKSSEKSRNPRNKSIFRRLGDFYRMVKHKYKQPTWKSALATGTHECLHTLLKYTGLDKHIPDDLNEGLVEKGTEEVTGIDSTIPGSTYNLNKKAAKKALDYYGFKTFWGALKTYMKDKSTAYKMRKGFREALKQYAHDCRN